MREFMRAENLRIKPIVPTEPFSFIMTSSLRYLHYDSHFLQDIPDTKTRDETEARCNAS